MPEFEAYTGKEESAEVALGYKVVTKLSRSLVGGRYHLYFDNFFSCIPLFDDLLKDNLYACGALRKDRQGIPMSLHKPN